MKKFMSIIIVIIMMTSLTLSIYAESDGYIVFETDGLEEIVKQTLNMKFNRKLKESDLLNVTELAITDAAMLADLNDIAYFKNLEILYLENQFFLNDLTGIEYCEKLKELTIVESIITDVSALSNIDTLEVFNIVYAPVNDISAVLEQPNLRTLIISNTLINDISDLKNNRTLELFAFNGDELKNVEVLAEIRSLNTLILYNIRNIQTNDMAFIKNKNLTKLELVNMSLENNIVNYIKNIHSLSYIDLSHNNITRFTPLYELKNVDTLIIDYNSSAEEIHAVHINMIKDIMVVSDLNINSEYLDNLLGIIDSLPDELLCGISYMVLSNEYEISYYIPEYTSIMIKNFNAQNESVLYESDELKITEFTVNLAKFIIESYMEYSGYEVDEALGLPYIQEFIDSFINSELDPELSGLLLDYIIPMR